MGFIFNSLGAGEILVVFAAALLLFGAKRLPQLARSLGRALHEMQQAANDLVRAVTNTDASSSVDQHASETHQQLPTEENQRPG